MSHKLSISGKLASWECGDSVMLRIDDVAYTLDGWAALSGRDVRVTVEALESESVDRLAGCKCERCGTRLSVFRQPRFVDISNFAVWCDHCRVVVGPYMLTAGMAIDAYLAAQKAELEPRCPHCGGKVYITQVLGNDQLLRYMAGCNCGAHGEGPTRQAALDALAEWLDKCPRCGGKAAIYYPEESFQHFVARCECGLESPKFDSERAAAQWWNKREARKCKQ